MKSSRKVQNVPCVRCGSVHESIRTYSVCSICLYDLRYNHCIGCGSTISSRLFTDYDLSSLFTFLLSNDPLIVSLPSLFSTSSSSSLIYPHNGKENTNINGSSEKKITKGNNSNPNGTVNVPSGNSNILLNNLSTEEAYRIVKDLWTISRIQNVPVQIDGRKWHSRCLWTFQPEWETVCKNIVNRSTVGQGSDGGVSVGKGKSKTSSSSSAFEGVFSPSPTVNALESIEYSVHDSYGHMSDTDHQLHPFSSSSPDGTTIPSSSSIRSKVIQANLYHDQQLHSKNYNFSSILNDFQRFKGVHSLSPSKDDTKNILPITYPIPLVSTLLETMDKSSTVPLPLRHYEYSNSTATTTAGSYYLPSSGSITTNDPSISLGSESSSSFPTLSVLHSSSAVYIDHPDAPPQQPFKSYSLEHLLLRAQCMGLVRERQHRFKSYKQTIIGKDFVNFCLYTTQCTTRDEAIKLGQAMLDTKLLLPIQTENILTSTLSKRNNIPMTLSSSSSVVNNNNNASVTTNNTASGSSGLSLGNNGPAATNGTTTNGTVSGPHTFEDKDIIYTVSFRKRASARDAVLSHVSYTEAAYESSLYNSTGSFVSRKERANTAGGYIYPQTEKNAKSRRLTAVSLSSPLPIVRVITMDNSITVPMNGNSMVNDTLNDPSLGLSSSTNLVPGPPSWEMRLAGTTFTNHTLTAEQEQSNVLYYQIPPTNNNNNPHSSNPPATVSPTNDLQVDADGEEVLGENDYIDDNEGIDRNIRKGSSESLKSTDEQPPSPKLQIQDLDVINEASSVRNNTNMVSRPPKSPSFSSSSSPGQPKRLPPPSTQKRNSSFALNPSYSTYDNTNNLTTPDRRTSTLSTASTVSSLTTSKLRTNSIDLTMMIPPNASSTTVPSSSASFLPPPSSTLKTNITTTAARIVSGAVMSIFKRSNLGSRVGIDTTRTTNILPPPSKSTLGVTDNYDPNGKSSTTELSATSSPANNISSNDDDLSITANSATKNKNNTVRKLAFTTTTSPEDADESSLIREENTKNGTSSSSVGNKNNRRKKKETITINNNNGSKGENILGNPTSSNNNNNKSVMMEPLVTGEDNDNDNDDDNNDDDEEETNLRTTDDRSTKDTKKKSIILTDEPPSSSYSSKLSLLTTNNATSTNKKASSTTNNSRSTKSTTVGNDYDGLGLGSDLDDDDVPKAVRNNPSSFTNNSNNNGTIISSSSAASNPNSSSSSGVFSSAALTLMNTASSSSSSSSSTPNIFTLLIQPSVWREQRIKIASLRKDLLQRTWKAGWLVKQGHVRKNWKKRWFILQGFLLSYCKKGPIVVNTSTRILNNTNTMGNNDNSNVGSSSSSTSTPTKKTKDSYNNLSSTTTTISSPKLSSKTNGSSGGGGMTTVITKAIEIHNDQEIIPAGILDIRDYTLEKAIIPRSSLCMRLCAKRVIDHEYYIYAETETEFVTWVKALSSAMRAWEDIDRSIAALQLAKSAALAASASADLERV